MNLRAAVNAKCRDCVHDPRSGGGTWREQVAQCSCPACPLWSVRPMPHSGPWKDAPRTKESIPPGWLQLPIGSAKSTNLMAKERTQSRSRRPEIRSRRLIPGSKAR